MLVIDEICIFKYGGEYITEKSYIIDYDGIDFYNMAIYLRDTKTGARQCLRSRPDKALFVMQLNQLKPYGYVHGDDVDDKYFFITVDRASLEMLDYVETIVETRIHFDNELCEFARKLPGQFTAIGESNSLFVIANTGMTLLGAMKFGDKGWLGDDFYIYCTKTIDYSSPDFKYCYVMYKIVFCDVVRAKRLFTKAMFLGGR